MIDKDWVYWWYIDFLEHNAKLRVYSGVVYMATRDKEGRVVQECYAPYLTPYYNKG